MTHATRKISGLPGFYTVRGVYSTKEGLNLAQIPDLIGLPTASEDDLKKKGYWYLAGSFQQYLYEDSARPGNGWGLFGYRGGSVANAMPAIYPIHAFAEAGGLMSYGTSFVDTYRQVGNYTFPLFQNPSRLGLFCISYRLNL